MSKNEFVKILAATAAFVAMACGPTPVAGAQITLDTILAFSGDTTGFTPESNLVADSAGNLYGTTGDSFADTVYELSPNSDGTWTESVLWTSSLGSEPYNIRAGVTFDSKGNLYGTSIFGGANGCGQVFKLTSNGGTWTYSDVLDFDCASGGSQGTGGVIFDRAGNMYGTTSFGGTYNWGTIYKLSPNANGAWTETILHNFTFGTDGGYPGHGDLVFGPKGSLYGNTGQGAEGNCQAWTTGCGTVYELSPSSSGTWTFTVLHSFTGAGDGGVPQSTMTFDKAGNLYGTTFLGGDDSCNYGYGNGPGCGVVFELTPGANGVWTEKVLHKFKGGEDGAYPFGGIIFDNAGNLYGNTLGGGNTNCFYGGCGTIYELSPNSSVGMIPKILVRFDGAPLAAPYNSLLILRGNLYGTTSGETTGTNDNMGGVYELTR
jgi:uncharacterized repeat protein (TIGR03803 family)